MNRTPTKSFQELIVWQKAHQFVLSVYRQTRTFPREEIYALTSQFRRAAVSVAANIAGGYKKRSRSDKARFMNMSQGSIEESRYYLILARDLGNGYSQVQMSQLEEVSKLLDRYCAAILA
jgi:four helix bundle protein